MKILKRAQFKLFTLLTAVLLAVISLWTGVQFLRVSADDTSNESTGGAKCIETDVKNIFVRQDPSSVFFGFELTESDYATDFDGDKKADVFEGDFGGTDTYLIYEDYIRFQLTYWENFSSMNSEGAKFAQLYAYWNGSSVGAQYANSVMHLTTLTTLPFGFEISIPAGTTFPSLTYVHGNCMGAPIFYKTKTTKTFYYDGSSFVLLAQEIAQVRTSVLAEINKVDFTLYEQEEVAEVKALMDSAKAQVLLSFNTFDVQDVLVDFETALDKIMTKADYAALRAEKELAIQTLNSFVDGLNQADYDTAEWSTILNMQAEGIQLLNPDDKYTIQSIEEVQQVLAGVQFAVGELLTKEEKAAFAEYCNTAIATLEKAFDATLYRAEERAQGEALILEGKQALEKATYYSAVDGILNEYLSKLSALKTQAEWEEEEKNNSESDSSTSEEDSNVKPETPAKESGCGSSVSSMAIIFGVAVLAMSVAMKRKKVDYKDEN